MTQSDIDPDILGEQITCGVLGGAGIGPRSPAAQHLSEHQMFWTTRGGGRVFIDGTQHGFGPNTAIFVPALSLFRIEFSAGTLGWRVTLPQGLPLDLPQTPVLASLVKPVAQGQFSKAFVSLNEEVQARSHLRGRALCHLAGLLAVQFSRIEPEALRKAMAEDSGRLRLFRRFVRLLDERHSTGGSVRDYAAALGVTTTHLTRVCRETTGKPATRLIQERSLQAARSLLSRSDMQVGEIARHLGYNTPAYFIRLFTARIGQSPGQFRRTARSQQGAQGQGQGQGAK